MGRVLVIGAGGVSTVAVKKIAMNADVFTDIMVASRTKSKCDKIAADIKNVKVQTAQVDADNVQELVALFNAFKPDLVVNLALPYQDLHIMDACLEYGVSYLDTANYEPLDEAKYQYSWQWAYKDRFEKAGLTAILGCGFDPGVTGVYTAYAAKHHFDEIHYLDIVDCNAGDHHKAFATNFNPESFWSNFPIPRDTSNTILSVLHSDNSRLYVRLTDRSPSIPHPRNICHVLDDFRTGILDSSTCHPKYRYGSYRPDPLQRAGNRSDPNTDILDDT